MSGLSAKGRALFVSVGSAVMVAGFVLIARGVSEWREGKASLTWSQTDGRITESEATRIPGGAKSGGGHSIRIRYRYDVGGVRHEGHRVNVGNHLDPEFRRDIASLHPVGSTVTVFYDPKDPDRSVLENGPSFSLPFAFVPGGFFVGVSGAVVFAAATGPLRHRAGQP